MKVIREGVFIVIDYSAEPLDEYMSQYPKVRILRMEKREGLIRSVV